MILVDVLKRTQKVIVFITDLKVSKTVDIEELVPMILTNEEEVTQLTQYNQEITAKLADIETLLAADTARKGDMTDKVIKGLAEIEIYQAQILEATDYAAAHTLAIAAIELADDLLAVLQSKDTQTGSSATSTTANASSTPAASSAATSTATTSVATTTASSTVDA